MTRPARGFTLLEVLVALVLLSVFAVTSYRALDSVLTAENHALAEMERWRRLSLAFVRINGDLANTVAGIESRHGQVRGLRAGRDDAGQPYFSFDRLLPEDQAGGVQRIGYRYADGTLLREVVRDGPGEPADAPVLGDLTDLGLRYLDHQGRWLAEWSAPSGPEALPRAVEMQFQFASGVPLRRVFLLR